MERSFLSAPTKPCHLEGACIEKTTDHPGAARCPDRPSRGVCFQPCCRWNTDTDETTWSKPKALDKSKGKRGRAVVLPAGGGDVQDEEEAGAAGSLAEEGTRLHQLISWMAEASKQQSGPGGCVLFDECE